MSADTITLKTPLPRDIYLVLQARGLSRQDLAERARQLLAMRCYHDRMLSLGKAARLAGLSRSDFINLLSDNQLPVIDYCEEEPDAKFRAVDQLAAELNPRTPGDVQ